MMYAIMEESYISTVYFVDKCGDSDAIYPTYFVTMEQKLFNRYNKVMKDFWDLQDDLKKVWRTR